MGAVALSSRLLQRVVQEKAVRLTADGKTKKYYTSAATVDDFFKEIKLELGSLDRVNKKLKAKIKDGLNLNVQRVTVKEITETQTIAFSTKSEYSSSLLKGKSEIRSEGKAGSKQCVYEITCIDGKEENRELKSEKVTVQPEDRIIVYGTK